MLLVAAARDYAPCAGYWKTVFIAHTIGRGAAVREEKPQYHLVDFFSHPIFTCYCSLSFVYFLSELLNTFVSFSFFFAPVIK